MEYLSHSLLGEFKKYFLFLRGMEGSGQHTLPFHEGHPWAVLIPHSLDLSFNKLIVLALFKGMV